MHYLSVNINWPFSAPVAEKQGKNRPIWLNNLAFRGKHKKAPLLVESNEATQRQWRTL